VNGKYVASKKNCPMTGTTSPPPQAFASEDVVKESIDRNTVLYLKDGSYFVIMNTTKLKSSKVIQVNDIYAAILNGLELKLESCPRVNATRWNPFKKLDQVRFP
jgi:hypothetical protein